MVLHLSAATGWTSAELLRRLTDMQYKRNELDLQRARIACAAT